MPRAASAAASGDIVFYDLQLPVLSSAPTQGAGPYPVPLGIARILAPVGTFLAAVGTLFLLLGEQWRRLQVAASRYHAIVAATAPSPSNWPATCTPQKRKLVLFSPKVVLVSSDDETLTQGRQAKLHGSAATRPTLARCAPRASPGPPSFTPARARAP